MLGVMWLVLKRDPSVTPFKVTRISRTREIFASEIWNPGKLCLRNLESEKTWNPGKLCLWNLESGKLGLWNLEFGETLLVESGIRRNFACEIWNPGKPYLWNLESGETLLVKSGIRGNFTCEIWNPGKLYLWNLESVKILLEESGVRENIACGIWNLGNFFWGIRDPPITIGVRNPSSSHKESGIQSLDSRIQDCLEFPYIGEISTDTPMKSQENCFFGPTWQAVENFEIISNWA